MMYNFVNFSPRKRGIALVLFALACVVQPITAQDSSLDQNDGISLNSEAPTIITQDITVQLGSSGTVSISPSQVDNGSFDPAGSLTLSLDISSFDCSNLGPNIVTLTGTNGLGESQSAQATVTVEDLIAPTVVTQSLTATISGGSYTIDPNDLLKFTGGRGGRGSRGSPITSDNCGIASVSASPATLSVLNLGMNIITVTVTDAAGNSSSGQTVVYLEDNDYPTAIAQDIEVELDENGLATITTDDIDNGSFDNGGINNMFLDKTTFDCMNLGVNEVTLTVIDYLNRTSTATAIVTVKDVTPPDVVTKDLTISLGEDGTYEIDPLDLLVICEDADIMISTGGPTGETEPGMGSAIDYFFVEEPTCTKDNCSITDVSVSIETFDCTHLGVNVVTVTVKDRSGNTSTATATVTVVDDIFPTVQTKNATVTLDQSGNASITVADVDDNSFDNCDITLSLDRLNFTCADVGDQVVTLTGVDPTGNSSSATAVVTVVDEAPPVAIAQPVTLTLDVNGTATLTASQVDNGSNDSCTGVTLSIDKASFDCSNLGDNVVTLTVTDGGGNAASVTTTVTIVDDLTPTVLTKNATISLDEDGNASITIVDIDNGSSDNCDLTLSLDKLNFTCDDLGQNTVTLTGVDGSGNTASATAVVTIEDNLPPSLQTLAPNYFLGPDGTFTIDPNDLLKWTSSGRGSRGGDITEDNCGIASMVVSKTVFDCNDIGQNLVTVTVTDAAGNSATATTLVTIGDNTLPTVIAQDATLELDENGMAVLDPALIDGGSYDNCDITLTVSPPTFSCDDIGVNTVTLIATDASGLSSSATATVTVVDNIAPEVVTQNITVVLDENGEAHIESRDLLVVCDDEFIPDDPNDGGSTGETVPGSGLDNYYYTTPVSLEGCTRDNCRINKIETSKLKFYCNDLGENVVTITVTDASGNSTTATAVVTVVDQTPPTVETKNISVSLDANGSVSITADDIDNGSSDNCDFTLTLDKETFDCSNIGQNIVTLTATDTYGNSTAKTAVVTVVDDIDPVVIAQDVTVVLDASGNGTLTVAEVDNGSYDNCDLTLSIDPLSFDCDDIGTTVTVTLTGVDGSGNSASAVANVTVVDNTPPIIVAPNITLALDEEGNAVIVAEEIGNGSTDNCGIGSYSLDKTEFDCDDLGNNTVTLTVTDIHGNVSTQTVTINVVDVTAPEVEVLDATVSLDENGNASIEPGDILSSYVEECTVEAYSSNNHAVWLSKYTASNANANFFFDENGGTLMQFNDGTATVTGIIVNKNDPNDSWAVQLNLAERRNWDEWSALGRSWKGNASKVGENYKDWTFYIMDTNPSNPTTLTGLGSNTGKVKTLSHKPANYNYGFQIGEAANDKNTDFGMSGWFTYENDQGNFVQGDFNLKITSCILTTGDGVCGKEVITIDKTDFDCTEAGANTVTVTVTDESGNTTVETSTVTIVDDMPPVVPTNDLTVVLDQNGNGSITIEQVDAGAYDNCEFTLVLSKTEFDCSDLGENTVTLTGTDINGNVTTSTATITVVDNQLPVVMTNNIIVALDDDGNASITIEDIDNGSYDNCDLTLELDKLNFDCDDIGQNTVTLTGTDAAGNVVSETAIVTVEDTTPPVVYTLAPSYFLDANGQVIIDPNDLLKWVGSGRGGGEITNDNCGIVSVEVSKTVFDCNDTGQNTVTVTVTDASGNSTTATTVVTIGDNTPPTIIAEDATIELDANGIATLDPAIIDGGSYDNCGVTLTVDQPTFSCDNLGPNTVTLIGTDPSGLTTTATATVTVVDNIAPTVVTQNITVTLDNNGEAVIETKDLLVVCDDTDLPDDNNGGGPVGETVPGAGDEYKEITTVADIPSCTSDNCQIASISASKKEFNCNDLGQNIVTVTVTDASGNTTTSTAVVTVVDETAPTIVAQDLTLSLDANGQASITPDQVDNGTSDNCDFTLSLDKENFDCSNVGTNVVTLTATDGSGNTSVATATITIVDDITPTVIARDVTVYLDENGNGVLTVDQVDNGSYDNCDITLSIDRTDFSCSDIGENNPIVTLTGVDPSGNTASATATVTVIDNSAPTVVTQNITAALDATGNAIISSTQINNGSSDNCGISSITLDKTEFDCDNLGDNTVTLTVTDVNGNTSTETATVTIVDNIAPTVIAQDITVSLDDSGNASITVDQIDNGSSDNCDITLSLDKLNFSCEDIGTNTVTLTGVDPSGNSSSATATVTVVDDTAPVINPQDITVALDQAGEASIGVIDVLSEWGKNCEVSAASGDGHAVWLSKYINNSQNVDFVFDSNGGTLTEYSDGTATITGTIVSTINSNDSYQVNLFLSNGVNWTDWSAMGRSYKDENGHANGNHVDWTYYIMDPAQPSTLTGLGDNAGETKVLNHMPSSYYYGFQVGVGANNKNPGYGISGWFSYTNDQGNEVQGDFNLDIDNCEITTGGGNCGVEIVTIDQPAFDCDNLGTNTVTITATDAYGNTSTATATVTITDDIAPTVLTKNITVSLDESGNVSISPEDVDNGSSDNCSLTLSLDQLSFDCDDVGQNTVTLTGTDNSGNTASATAVVTVEDNINPTVITQNISVSLDANGSVTISASQIDNGSSDNCEIGSITLDKATFDCEDLGDNTVTLTVVDSNGNQSSATATVTVVDDIDPVVITQDITIALDANGNATITTNQVDNGSYDNCDLSLSLDKVNFSCDDLGENTVTLSGEDSSGNTGSATAKVTVVDNSAPVISGMPSNLVYQETDTDCGQTITWTTPTVTDNCDVTVTSSHNSGDFFPVGTTTVSYTATDNSGNQTVESFTVEVVPVALEISLSPSVFNTDEGYNISCEGAADGSIDASISGGCSPYSISWSNGSTDEDISNLGPGTYSVTVTDANGTSATAQVTLTEPDELGVAMAMTPRKTIAEYGEMHTIYLGYGEQYAMIEANAYGGNEGYTYDWSPSTEILCEDENVITVAPEVTTTYTVVVTDANGCTTTEEFTVNVVDARCVTNDNTQLGDALLPGIDDPLITGNAGENQVSKEALDLFNTRDKETQHGKGSESDSGCDCEGKMQNFTVKYTGFSGLTVRAHDKYKNVIQTFYNVQFGDELKINGFGSKGELDSKTYLSIFRFYQEVHTSCSEDILGNVYGPFTVISYTDGKGNYCDGSGNSDDSEDDGDDDDDSKDDDDDDKDGPKGDDDDKGGKDDDDDKDSKDDDDDDKDGPKGDDDDKGGKDDDDDKDSKDDDDDDKGGKDDDDDKDSKDDDDDDKGGKDDDDDDGDDDGSCQCEGKMQNFTVRYTGPSGIQIKAYDKKKKKVIATFNNVNYGDELTVNGFSSKGQLDSKTYLKIGSKYYKVHTSCSEDILGDAFGPFEVISYTDGEGSYCDGSGHGGDNGGGDDDDDDGKGDDDDDDGKGDDDDDDGKGDDDDDDGKGDDDDDDGKGDDDDDDGKGDDDDDDDDDGDDDGSCQCEGKMQNFTLIYRGASGVTVNAYKKKGGLLKTYTNVQSGDHLIFEGFDHKGRLDSKTYVEVEGGTRYEVHTSCSEQIIGKIYGPFEVFSYTDGEGSYCEGNPDGDIEVCGTTIPQWHGKITMCYNGQTICVPKSRVYWYLERGGSLGSCEIVDPGNVAGGLIDVEEGVVNRVEERATVPNVQLSAYPNPTTDKATINFTVNQAGPVAVNVYSTDGLLVGKLYEGDAEANTNYTLVFEPGDVANGVYLVRLQTAGYIRNLKLLVKR